MYCSTEALNYNTTYVASVYHVQTPIIALFKDVHKYNIVNMIIPINWLNYYVAIYRYMKTTYHNHDMEDYIDYHDIRYILHITNFKE